MLRVSALRCTRSIAGTTRGRQAQRVAQICRVGCRRYAPVAAMVQAAGEPERLPGGGRLNVAAVDANCGRADEMLAPGVGVGVDLTDDHGGGVEPQFGHRGAQIGERTGMRGAAGPVEKLDTHMRPSLP